MILIKKLSLLDKLNLKKKLNKKNAEIPITEIIIRKKKKKSNFQRKDKVKQNKANKENQDISRKDFKELNKVKEKKNIRAKVVAIKVLRNNTNYREKLFTSIENSINVLCVI